MSLLRSWLETANDPDGPFPMNNLPLGVFSAGGAPRCCTAIGDQVLDLGGMERAGYLRPMGLDAPALNDFMAKGPETWANLRATLFGYLAEGSSAAGMLTPFMHPLDAVRLHLPFRVAEYTDFYAGRHHAENVGTLFRGSENALPPNWLHMPIGYNGRSSTVIVSGTDVHRPQGQTKAPDADLPTFGPCQRLDMELELGAVIGSPSTMGTRVSVAEADAMIFGYVLLNDWSARDIQAWEYQPLGPFQSKAFATTISPWVVTKAALEPFRRLAPQRDIPLLPYLEEPGPMFYDITLSAALQPEGADAATTICQTNARELYYSAAQQLAHHTASGCAMRTGDLLGSGTISGADTGSHGSLLELTWGGENPLTLENDGTRTFLEDGDRVTLHGHAQGDGYRIGFGECTGRILPARTTP
ncbi:fumarylacetoacetase [Tropicimonas isoalkanivorans]|uniref:fumarylacetoacetase n=1 Tax=Tropicimonas isoalkanivorans TaxID=441112 RepID=A0A1I1LC79_9RHOB|nr:fumarylacetoacetase [Tropicimonas isoalkanivorans]SFC70565.1 fumarylacetoacetate hydrolase [Tropicimonas isoalkanivorans]